MTTIAASVKEGVMVSDSRVTAGAEWFPATKIYRIAGELIGIAGDCMDEQRWLKWHRGGRKGVRPKLENFAAVVLKSDGLYVYSGSGLEMLVERGFHAIGSGGPVALGAMLAGADVKQAVEIACQVDACTGGDICVFELKEPGK